MALHGAIDQVMEIEEAASCFKNWVHQGSALHLSTSDGNRLLQPNRNLQKFVKGRLECKLRSVGLPMTSLVIDFIKFRINNVDS